MKLTKKFWKWIGQIVGLIILVLRMDLVSALLKLIPFADVRQFYSVFALFILVIALWSVWLIWRGYEGFYRRMNFLIEDTGRNW